MDGKMGPHQGRQLINHNPGVLIFSITQKINTPQHSSTGRAWEPGQVIV